MNFISKVALAIAKTQQRRNFQERRESFHGGSAKTSMFSTVLEISSPLSLCESTGYVELEIWNRE